MKAATKKIPWTSTMVTALTVLIIVIISTRDLVDLSPGPLSGSHGQEPHLLEADSCQACHGDGARGMTESCLACHAPISEQLAAGAGLHGLMDEARRRDCGACHSEHHGEAFALVSEASFRKSGIDDPRAFDHAGLPFELAGKHVGAACEACHTLASAAIIPKGRSRFLGLEQDCDACHEDIHEAAFGGDCVACHGQEAPFPEAPGLDHDRAFALAGAHAEADCQSCHAEQRAVPALVAAGLGQGGEARSCGLCHASPHGQAFAAAASKRLGQAVEDSCAACHDAERSAFHGDRGQDTLALHADIGVALTAPHADLDCRGCHAGFAARKEAPERFAAAFPGRDVDDCAACHADVHAGQFAGGAFAGARCLDCHERHAFEPPRFDAARHSETRFALVGAHRELDCRGCHDRVDSFEVAGAAVEARAFVGTPQSCASCHEDAHAGQFARGAFAGRDCQACHDEHGFDQPRFDMARHSETRFELVGAHRELGCRDCHEDPSAGPRVFVGTPEDCASCHEDVHAGQFAGGAFAGQGCEACHDERGFSPPSFDLPRHAATRFPLTGAHQAIACRSCHDKALPGAGAKPGPRAFAGTPRDCASCHVDVHGSGFTKPSAARSCERCHTTESFERPAGASFDHAAWTGFALDGAHGAVRCADCHSPRSTPDALGRSFGRAAGRSCQSCHQDPHVGQFGPSARVSCQRCHSVRRSFSDLVFDHQRDSRFKLDDKHKKLACDACHRPARLRSGGTATRYKPLGIECGDCHEPKGGGR